MAKSADPKVQLREALNKAEELLGGDIVAYNGPINEDGYGQFVQATKNIKADQGLVLALVTYGGSADSAYRIARYSQNYFKDFIVYVPSACKSAGTLIALGASKIYMSPFGELGPLDVQVAKADEIFERRSGLLSKSAVWSLTEEAFRTFESVLINLKVRSGGTVGFKACSTVAAAITTGLLGPIASQLDPLSIGEDYQNLHIAQEDGEKLIQKFNVIDTDAVSALVENYPSHGFVIDLFEASDLLGNVQIAPPELIQLQACLPELTARPHGRDATVIRVRDLLGEDDDQADSTETATADSGTGSQLEGEDQPIERQDRRIPTSSRVGQNGNNPPGKSAKTNGAARTTKDG